MPLRSRKASTPRGRLMARCKAPRWVYRRCSRLRTLISRPRLFLGIIEPCSPLERKRVAIIRFVIASARKNRWNFAPKAPLNSEGGWGEWAAAGVQPIGCIRALCHLLSLPTANRRIADKRFERCLKLRHPQPPPLTPAGFLAVTRAARAVPSGIRPPFGRKSRLQHRGSSSGTHDGVVGARFPLGLISLSIAHICSLLGPYSQEKPEAGVVLRSELYRILMLNTAGGKNVLANVKLCEYGPRFLSFGS